MASDSVSAQDFAPKGQKLALVRDVHHPRWWTLEGQKAGIDGQLCAGAIQNVVKGMQERQSTRLDRLISCGRLYGNATIRGVSGLSTTAMLPKPIGREQSISDNVIQNIVDTSTARIGENKPRPYFLTDGGSYKVQRKAKKLNKFAEGIFYETKAYRLGSDAQRDAEVFGDGLLFVSVRHNRVRIERVLSAEVWIDEVDGLYGRPRQMHWVRAVDREELQEWVKQGKDWSGKKAALAAVARAARAPLYTQTGQPDASDMVLVRESWHLRSGPDATDGKHCISIDNALLDPLSDWPHDFFPFARWRWSPRPMGYWSQGLCEQLSSKQIQLNKLDWTIDQSMHRAGSYKVFVEDGSKIVSEHLNNEIGSIIKYRGKEPSYFVPQAVHPDYFTRRQQIIESMYERAGMSQLTATGQKPQGLDSGEAIRNYRDTVSEGAKTKENLNEDAFMDLAKICIAMAREVAEEEGSYEVRAPSGRVLKSVKLTAADLDPADFEMQCFPTSSLPKDPAGRLQTIQEYIQAGFMTPRQGRRALDFPDLEAVESLANAAEDLLCEILDGICDEGEYAPPEPTDDLKLGKELVVEYINRGRSQDLEDERLDLLRQWSAQLDWLVQLAMPPAPPPMPGMVPGGPPGMPPGGAMGPGMGPPQAMPMAPPQSALVPNMPMAA